MRTDDRTTSGGRRRGTDPLVMTAHVLGWVLLAVAALFAVVAISMVGSGSAGTIALAAALAGLFVAGGSTLLALVRRVGGQAARGGAAAGEVAQGQAPAIPAGHAAGEADGVGGAADGGASGGVEVGASAATGGTGSACGGDATGGGASAGSAGGRTSADVRGGNVAGGGEPVAEGAAAGTTDGQTSLLQAKDAPQAPAIAGVTQAPAGTEVPEALAKDADAESVAALVMRSDDVFATLKDLVRHEYGLDRPSSRHLLATMLEASGLMGWSAAPACGAGRLTRTHHYWVRADVDQLDDASYDTLVAAEAALGLNQDLPAGLRRSGVGDPEVEAALLRVLDDMVDQRIADYDFARDLACAYPGATTESAPSEWVARVGVAHAAECVRTPFRVVYDQQSNVAEGLVMLALETPRPRCFAIFASSPERQAALARSYALRLAGLLGRLTLAVSEQVREVQVVCYEHGGDQTLLAARLTREALARLAPALHAEVGVLPDDEAVRARVGEDGRLAPVAPFGSPHDARAYPPERRTYPELNPLLSRPALAAATGAAHVCDLGINESAGRHAAWDMLAAKPWGSTTEAVAALVAMRDAADDITVAEACSRTAAALVDGAVEVGDLGALHALFVDGTALDLASRRAAELLASVPGEGGDPTAAAGMLEAALAPVDAVGAYLDDADTIYRYFGSVAERVCFNRDLDNHARAVRLVPDAYFDAKGHLATAYIELGRLDEALAVADEMIHLAPTSAFAVLRKVRALEAQSRVFEAADLIRGALARAWTPRDAAVCHYRLAYMEWRLGREDVAVACYQRALRWSTDVSAQAHAELDDLLSANAHLRPLAPDQADALLAREGIPLGCTEGDQRRLLAAAITCCDEGIFRIARPLVGILFSIESDDVMMGAYRSLVV